MKINSREDLKAWLDAEIAKNPNLKKELEKQGFEETLSDVNGGATAIEYGLIAALIQVALVGQLGSGKKLF